MRDVRQQRFPFVSGYLGRQWLPAVPVTEQDNERRLESGSLTTADLSQANFHGLLIECGLLSHSPSQINGLKTRRFLLALLAKLGKNFTLQGIPLLRQVLKSGTYEHSERTT